MADVAAQRPALSALRIFVDDLAGARDFYEDTLGLPLVWTAEGALGFDVGVSLIVESVPADADDDDRALVGRFVGCSFAVDDIDAHYTELAGRGVTFHGPPAHQQWGGHLAHFDDPAGNVLTLVQYPRDGTQD